MLFARERAVHSKTFIMHRESGIKIESREIQSPNLLIWSQTRCRCAIPPVDQKWSIVNLIRLNIWCRLDRSAFPNAALLDGNEC